MFRQTVAQEEHQLERHLSPFRNPSGSTNFSSQRVCPFSSVDPPISMFYLRKYERMVWINENDYTEWPKLMYTFHIFRSGIRAPVAVFAQFDSLENRPHSALPEEFHFDRCIHSSRMLHRQVLSTHDEIDRPDSLRIHNCMNL